MVIGEDKFVGIVMILFIIVSTKLASKYQIDCDYRNDIQLVKVTDASKFFSKLMLNFIFLQCCD